MSHFSIENTKKKKNYKDYIYFLSKHTSFFHRFIAKVVFQFKAWCDENIMKSQISEDWSNHFLNPATLACTGKILFVDIHRAQQTSSVKQLLHKNKTVLGGATSTAQAHDVATDKPFKKLCLRIILKNILIKTLLSL